MDISLPGFLNGKNGSQDHFKTGLLLNIWKPDMSGFWIPTVSNLLGIWIIESCPIIAWFVNQMSWLPNEFSLFFKPWLEYRMTTRLVTIRLTNRLTDYKKIGKRSFLATPFVEWTSILKKWKINKLKFLPT